MGRVSPCSSNASYPTAMLTKKIPKALLRHCITLPHHLPTHMETLKKDYFDDRNS
jgi:hypothetical protein